jgi:hypothetical protein
VNAGGQLYTIEGVAASLILLLTAYIVVNSTSVYTPGDSHISDMQLEVMGSDALSMMNVPQNGSIGRSPLQIMVENNDGPGFNNSFSGILNSRAHGLPDSIQFAANVTYVVNAGTTIGEINTTRFSSSPHALYGGEHAVRVSEWVIVDNWNGARMVFPECPGTASTFCSGKHAALVEVFLWRD